MPTPHVDLDPSATIAPTAVIGAPYRRLQQGEWERLNRPTRIGAHCDIGPFCVVGDESVIGKCTILDSYSLVEWGATVGNNVIITHRASIGARASVGDDCVIGGLICERSIIGSGSRVLGDLLHRQLTPAIPWDAPEAMEESPTVEDGAFIGWGAKVIGGIKIGKGAYVCAGATVTRDVDPGTIVKGINETLSPDEWRGALGRSMDADLTF